MNSLADLRKHYLQKRQHLSPEVAKAHSHQINQHLLNSTYYLQAKTIALYHAIHQEVSLNALWQQACYDQKKTYFPVIKPTGILSFYPLTPEEKTCTNRYHITEPLKQKHPCAIECIDLMLIPLVAFDLNGIRLGHGKGYYDKTLAQQKPGVLLGVGYHCQEHPGLPYRPWDIPLDGIVTEHGLLLINKTHS